MNPLTSFCLMAFLVATAFANSPNQRWTMDERMKPTQWLSTSELESLSPVDEITLRQLEKMSVEKGAQMVKQLYHLSQINNDLTPSFVPSASNIPTYFIQPNGQNITVPMSQMVAIAKQQPNFGDDEVTIFITGLPPQTKDITKATRKLVEAYQQRYSGQKQYQRKQGNDENVMNRVSSSSEEESSESQTQSRNVRGNLVVIDLGATLTTFKRFAMLDVEQTGDMIGKVLVQLTNQCDVPQEIIHVVAQGIGAHVAGAAGRQYTRLTGHQLRRITALDPSKVFAKRPEVLFGLARGDAQFIDAIHTSAYGMGMPTRVGDVDFYPNGPSAGVPGTDNLVEASVRATRYFAESVIPGNERSFPAMAARSLEEYKNNDSYGPRAFMGINTEFDVKGDYILETNPSAPFGKAAPARRQNNEHGAHQSWKNPQDY